MASFFGTAGDDTITSDVISPGVVSVPPGSNLTGDDNIRSFGGNDTVEGDSGSDTALLGSGNDRFIWDPGDGNDTVFGGAGIDTLEFNGSDDAEHMTVTTLPNGGFQFFRDVGNITITTRDVEKIAVDALGGDDRIDALHQTDPLVRLTVDAGDGNDRIIGGAGSDAIEGGRGDDVAFGRAGNDSFAWDPGDGNDTFRGGLGTDTLVFDGSNDTERMTITTLPDGGFRFFRDVGNITITTRDVEKIAVKGLGGDDIISGSAQTRTDVSLLIRGGAGSDRLTGGAGTDTFIFGGESHNGLTEIDTIRAYHAGDIVNLRAAGGFTASSVVGGNLQLTLAGADHDTLIIRGVTNLADVQFVL